jgi:hypothetical protein
VTLLVVLLDRHGDAAAEARRALTPAAPGGRFERVAGDRDGADLDPGAACGVGDTHTKEMLARLAAIGEVRAAARLLEAAVADGVAFAEHPARRNLIGVRGDGPDQVATPLEVLEGALGAAVGAAFLGGDA